MRFPYYLSGKRAIIYNHVPKYTALIASFMKNNNSFWLFLAWLLVTIGLVAGLAIYQNYQAANKAVGTLSTKITSLSGVTLNMTEIAKHNSASDCWLLINDKVYDVTAAISAHPGGSSAITRHCGQEATQAFNTKDVGRPHSGNAASQLAAYYIGDFDQTLGQATVQPNISNPTVANSNPTISLVKPIVSVPAGELTLNLAEIAKHNSASDCWLLISNKVYNVTSFISSHPGGAGPILTYCGQEATQAYNTKDIGRPHSSSATAMLASYYIGDFNQTIGQSQIQQSVQQTNTVAPPTRGREDNNGD